MEWIMEWIKVIMVVIGIGGIVSAFLLNANEHHELSVFGLLITIVILIIGIIVFF